MAKGNPLMSQMRGKVGDLVFTRLAGEQITRSRNRNPKNPQTIKQMAQRAALATCVEFFTRGRKNLFKFAFENKRPGESDYNAFVRANIGIMPVQSHKSLVENRSVFGPVILSQGSLSQPDFAFDDDHSAGAIICNPLPADANTLTVGQLSKAIAEHNGLQDGDIITIVAIVAFDDRVIASLEEAVELGALQSQADPQSWIIRQFTLDFNSTALASSIDFFDSGDFSVKSESIGLHGDAFPNLTTDEEWSAGLAVIASRNTPSGVKVSTSTIKLSYRAKDASEIGTSDEWREYVAKNWQTSNELDVKPENILQGSISVN